MQKPLISIIVPVYNEELNVPLIHEALTVHTKKLSDYSFELIFVDDGSRDKSVERIVGITYRDKRMRLLQFARNFGKEAAVSAGLHAAKGDAAIILDADLQHPPELIPKFIEKWKKGAEVIVGIRKYSNEESWFKKFSSRWFYKIMDGISNTKITPHSTDFRLLDRSAIDAFNVFTEHNRITRGLIDWLGFKRSYIKFEAPPRKYGQAAYSYKQLFRLALNSITAHSLLPLRIAMALGIVILLTAGPLGLFIFYEKYIATGPDSFNFTGTAALAVIVMFLVGVVLVCLGLIAMYIARIYEETTNRPLYIIKQDTAPDESES